VQDAAGIEALQLTIWFSVILLRCINILSTCCGVVDEWNILPLVVLCIAYHLLATWTYGLSVSSGVFIPSLFIGALWGRVIGMLIMAVWPAAVRRLHVLLYSLVKSLHQHKVVYGLQSLILI